jgi:hypothetical protein
VNVIDTKDVFGNTVCLSESRWKSHILATHPEMEQYLSEIANAISQPHCVYTSNNDPNAKLFFRKRDAKVKYGNLYLKAVVSYEAEHVIVKTAFFTRNITGGDLLWIQAP